MKVVIKNCTVKMKILITLFFITEMMVLEVL